MYLPTHFEETRLEVLQALVRAHPLGTWVTSDVERRLVVNHVPFLLDAGRGAFGTLQCHVARANPVWKAASHAIESVVVFQGAQSYITPSWYPSKREHGKAVPTWNYVTVHAHGVPRVIEDREWLREHVTALSDIHESREAMPWRVSEAPADFIEAMLGAIVGIEIPLRALVGKWKTSQNRPLPDRIAIVAGLEARGDDQARGMAALVETHEPGHPGGR